MRARRSRTWWQSTVAAWRTSGLSAEQFAAEHGVHPGALRWRRRQVEIDAEGPFTALALQRVEVADVAALVTAIAQAAARC
jgi:hypothetical protein